MIMFKSYFREYFDLDVENRAFYPSIQERIDDLTQDEANKIYAYMKQCMVVMEYVSPISDPMDKSILVPNIDRTDGVYFWNDMIAHVIKTYRIRLPDEFKQHVDKQLSSGEDNIKYDIDPKFTQELFDKIEKVFKEDQNIWLKAKPGALVFNIDELLIKYSENK